MDENRRAWEIVKDVTFDPMAIVVVKEGTMEELKKHCTRLAEQAMFTSMTKYQVTKDNVFTFVPELEYRKSKGWKDLLACCRLPAWAQGKTEREIEAIATRFMRVLKLKAKPNG